jgi:F-type H+-transporting ATPase subunit delta
VARKQGRHRWISELGNETDSLDALVREIGHLAAAYEASDEFRDALENPLVTHEAKRAILDEITTRIGASQMVRNLARMLGDRRRMRALPRIAQLLKEMADARKGVVHAEVTSAVQLSDDFYSRLQRELERMTHQKIVLDRRVDASIVGGVAVRVGDTVIDGSLRASLHDMRSSLLAAEVTRSNGAAPPVATA